MIIGIIGAIRDEIKLLKKKIDNVIHEYHYSYHFYIGYFYNIKIILLKSGVGKVSSSIATTLLINLYHPKIIINIGSAGSLYNSCHPGDLIIPDLISYHDVNLTDFGYKIGQIPGFPRFFKINNKLFKIYKKIIIKKKIRYIQGILITGDDFINNKEKIESIKKKFNNVIAVDMESASIAQVCYKFNIPFLIIRSISDFSNPTGYIHFKKFISISTKNNFDILKYILSYLNEKMIFK